jgi:hypothetical protein
VKTWLWAGIVWALLAAGCARIHVDPIYINVTIRVTRELDDVFNKIESGAKKDTEPKPDQPKPETK